MVGDETIPPDVPVTFLLSLEHQLTDILGLFRALQVTDPAEKWDWSEEDSSYRSHEPEVRLRTEKGLKSLVLIDPTQRQPGKAQAVPDERRVGTWKMTKYSGAVPRDRKAQLVERCTTLLGAVRQARERANRAHADPVSVGREVFAYLVPPFRPEG
jgi:hypothetical protein